MKITLGSKDLLEKLKFLNTVVGSKTTMPILDNFHFLVDRDQMTLTASDLETTMSTSLMVDASEPCNIALPSAMLIEILKSFPDQPLVFNVMKNNTVEIVSASGDYSIAYSDGNEFPKVQVLEDGQETELPANILAEAISKTLFATGNDDMRPVMAGVFFQFTNEGLNFVATDAHKLVRYSRKDYPVDAAFEFVVPRKPLNVLKGVLGNSEDNVLITYNHSNVRFHANDYTITCRLIDAKYPNYQAVIPTENPNVMTVNRAKFLNSVKCVSIFANKQTHQVKLDIDGTSLHLSAEDVDYSNKAEERMTCNYSGEPFQIGFNARFLTEMLSVLSSENIQIEMSLPNRAGLITPIEGLSDGEELLMLVMPVMIK